MNYTRTAVLLGLALTPWILTADDDWDISRLDLTKLPPAAETQGLTYANDIRPLFEASCFGCHGEEKHKGDLRLDSLEAVLKGGDEGKVVLPGDSKNSLLVVATSRIDDEIAMPPKPKPRRPNRSDDPPADGSDSGNPPGSRNDGPQGQGNRGGAEGPRRGGPPPKPLTAEQVGLIRAWIDQGAK